MPRNYEKCYHKFKETDIQIASFVQQRPKPQNSSFSIIK